jgi:hypothetical protein
MFLLILLSVLFTLVNSQHVTETFTSLYNLSGTESLVEYGSDNIITCNSNQISITDVNTLEVTNTTSSLDFNGNVCSSNTLMYLYSNLTGISLFDIETNTFQKGFNELTNLKTNGFNVAGSRLAVCDTDTGNITVFSSNSTNEMQWYEVSVINPSLSHSCLNVGFTTCSEGEMLVAVDVSNNITIWTLDGDSDDIEYKFFQEIDCECNLNDLRTAWNDNFYIGLNDNSTFYKYSFISTEWEKEQEEYTLSDTKIWTVGKNDGTLISVSHSDEIRVVHHTGEIAILDDNGKPNVVHSISAFDFTKMVIVDGDNELIHAELEFYTDAPTGSPTDSPTQSPTKNPTASPTTPIPSTSPTSSPTNSPTTGAPTTSPTTATPTNSPTTSAPTTGLPTRSPVTGPPTTPPPKSTTLSPSVILIIVFPTVIFVLFMWIYINNSGLNFGAREF